MQDCINFTKKKKRNGTKYITNWTGGLGNHDGKADFLVSTPGLDYSDKPLRIRKTGSVSRIFNRDQVEGSHNDEGVKANGLPFPRSHFPIFDFPINAPVRVARFTKRFTSERRFRDFALRVHAHFVRRIVRFITQFVGRASSLPAPPAPIWPGKWSP